MKRIVLLNPPWNGVVIRDYFCSKVSQASYINPPVDFVCQSGRLAAEGFDVQLVDAVVEKLTPERCRERIRELAPDAVVSLTGVVSWREDAEFLESLGVRPLILIGDIFLEEPEKRLAEAGFADALLLDFSSDSLAKYLLGERDGLTGIAFRGDAGGIELRPTDFSPKTFSMPVPLHELFIKLDYRYPFVAGTPFVTVLTEYGCPHACDFCIMGRLGHKVRPVEEVLDELRVVASLGVRDVFFMDQTFGTSRERTVRLLEAIAAQAAQPRWLCFSRADRATPDLLPLMKRAGCHTIIYGIETADDELLKSYHKGYTFAQVREAMEAARREGVRTVGTLILGLPGDTPAGCDRTIDEVKALPLDFISINIAAPRPATPMRRRAIEDGAVPVDLDRMDQSGTFIAMEHGGFTREEIMQLKRRAVREFYLNAPYMLRRIAGLRSPAHFAIEARQGLALIGNFVKGR